jgi:hypothetical protein
VAPRERGAPCALPRPPSSGPSSTRSARVAACRRPAACSTGWRPCVAGPPECGELHPGRVSPLTRARYPPRGVLAASVVQRATGAPHPPLHGWCAGGPVRCRLVGCRSGCSLRARRLPPLAAQRREAPGISHRKGQAHPGKQALALNGQRGCRAERSVLLGGRPTADRLGRDSSERSRNGDAQSVPRWVGSDELVADAWLSIAATPRLCTNHPPTTSRAPNTRKPRSHASGESTFSRT